MRKMSIGILTKIWASISILVVAYFVSNIRNFRGTHQIESQLRDLAAYSLPATRQSQQVLNLFQNATKNCEDAVVLGHRDLIEDAENTFKQSSALLATLSETAAFSPERRKETAKLRSDLIAYYQSALPLYERMTEGLDDDDLMIDVAEAGQVMADIQKRLEELFSLLEDTLLDNVDVALNYSQRQIRLNMILFLFVLGVSIPLVTFCIKHWIIRQIKQVVRMANRVADGELPDALPGVTRDEIGELERAFNRMADANHRIVEYVKKLAQGNYQIDLQPRSEQDVLIHSLVSMTQALDSFNAEGRRQNWLKGGLSELGNTMRGEQEMHALCDHILRFIAEYVGAEIGILFMSSEEETLKAEAGFGFRDDPENPIVVRYGAGLVGEAAARQNAYHVDDIDEPAMLINVGYGQISPRHIHLQPLVYQDETVGVLELGAVQPFTDLAREFLSESAESVAITLRTAETRLRVRELLHETQRQSSELQQQQEEMQQTNVELEERTELLEKQKQEIRRQNKDLEAARLDMERKARDLEQANKYKSEFLANMSHELRTPLNSLLILSRLLAENKPGNLNEKQVEFARTINKSGTDLLTLINDILDLSKVEAGKMEFHIETISIRQLCNDVRNTFLHVAEEKKLEFDLDIADDLPGDIHTDAQRVGQILRNLLANAFKFTSEGRVAIRVYTSTPEELGADKPGVGFEISDTGIGIPEEKRNLIFSAFQQADGSTSRKYGGTGLGLSISREFALRLGGRINVESESGKGSAFTLLLPFAAPGAENLPAPESWTKPPAEPVPQPPTPGTPAAPAPKSRTATPEKKPSGSEIDNPFIKDDRDTIGPDDRVVLIIEDDPKFASILVAFANEKNCKAVATSDGENGIRLARKYQPVGIILDMMLPGMDGRDVLGRLKENPATRHIPVHVVSALDEDKQVFRLGAIGFLSKPVSTEQLQDVFSQFDAFKDRGFRRLLLVEDDPVIAASLTELLDDLDIETKTAQTGQAALALMQDERFDCIILDLGLPDMPGTKLLENMMERKDPRHIPLIIHTARDLTREEEAYLRQFSESIIIKGIYSAHRLLDEVSLFLHVVREKEEPVAAPHEDMQPPPDPEPAAAPPPMAVQDDLKGRKALIVDDDMRNAYSLTAVFDGEGMDYLVASDGMTAIETLQDNGDIDIVLMDIMMPGMDGYETIARIRQQDRFKEVPIIALTAKAMKGDREKCIDSGANDYLPKPIDTDKLLSMMRTWMHK